MSSPPVQGVLAPVLTPFRADGSPDRERFLAHCRWLLGQGAGLLLAGTTSEANSLTMEERMGLLDHLLEAGLGPETILVGTGCCALGDTVRLSAHASRRGCAGVLVLPPFYYKTVSEEGLFRAYAQILEQVGSPSLRLYLYHIPQVCGVALSLGLIERLRAAFPGNVVGIKDSSGDWSNAQAMHERFPGFHVFVGTETLMLDNLRAGGRGCITATANVNPGPLARLWAADTPEGNDEALRIRRIFQRYPTIPALKAALARHQGCPDWARVRPPLVELEEAQGASLQVELQEAGFQLA